MKIYFVSLWWLLKFSALGLGIGIWVAYGAGGLQLGHWWANIIITIAVLYISAQIFQVLIFHKSGIMFLSYSAVLSTPFENIKGISLQGRDISKTRIVVWPTESRREIAAVENNASTLLIELLRENRKRRVPLRLFSSRDRTAIVRTLLDRVEKSGHT
jgi:hypothetical protein